MTKRVVTFGEIMLRLSPPGHERLLQSPTLSATFGGAEANVADSTGDWNRRSNPGGLSRSMISPKDTTRAG